MPRSYRSGMRRTSITAIAIIVLSVIWASPQLDAAPPPAATFHGLIPARLLDTRPGATTIDGQSQGTGPVATGSITNVTVSGRAGVPTDAGAVALTVTAVNPTAASFVTVWPAGSTRPTASNLNLQPRITTPNMVIVPLGNGDRYKSGEVSDSADCFDTSRRSYASVRPGEVTGFSIMMPSPWYGGPLIQRCPPPICNGLLPGEPVAW